MTQDLELFYSKDDGIPAARDQPKGTKVLRGRLWTSNDGLGWQINGIDLQEVLAQYRSYKVMLVIAPMDTVSQPENDRFLCNDCGFPLDDLGQCLRCQWYNVVKARQHREELFQEIDRIVEQSWAEPYP